MKTKSRDSTVRHTRAELAMMADLYVALYNGQFHDASVVIKRGAYLGFVTPAVEKAMRKTLPKHISVSGFAALHTALFKHAPRWLVETMLFHGASATEPDRRGNTPLHYAAGSQSGEDCIPALIARGASAKETDREGGTALHYARSVRAVNDLLDAGAEIEAKRRDEEITPLHQAVMQASADVLETLLKRGADPNAQTDRGSTPLHLTLQGNFASFPERLSRIVHLLNAGANPMLQNKQGESFASLYQKYIPDPKDQAAVQKTLEVFLSRTAAKRQASLTPPPRAGRNRTRKRRASL